MDRRYNHKVTLFTPQPDLPETGRLSTVDFVLKYGHVHTTDEDGNPTSYYFTSGDIQREGEDKPSAKLELCWRVSLMRSISTPTGMIALYEKGTRTLAAGWSYLKLLGHWQRKHNRAAYVPYLREDNDGNTSVEFGPLVTLGISTSFGLFSKRSRTARRSMTLETKPPLPMVGGRRTPAASSASTSTTSPPFMARFAKSIYETPNLIKARLIVAHHLAVPVDAQPTASGIIMGRLVSTIELVS